MSDIKEKQIPGLNIRIERTSCIASANCIKAAPGFFELDEENICTFKEPAANEEQEIIKEACSVCPVNALFVFDESGKQLVP